MLNTIYEEFDFESKIKELKNKKIKIRRVQKGDRESLNESILNDSSDSIKLKESIILEKKASPQTKLTPTKEEAPKSTAATRKAAKATNPMFLSNVHDLKTQGKGAPKTNDVFRSTAASSASGQGGPGPADASSGRIKFEDSYSSSQMKRMQEKKDNMMFQSHADFLVGKRSAGGADFAKELEEYMLPKTVLRFLADEEINIKKVEDHVQLEKKKIDMDIDRVIREVISLMNMKRLAFHSKFDKFLETFVKNYENLKSRVRDFKECSRLQRKKTLQKQFSTTLKNITYMGKNINNYDTLLKLKDDQCKISATIDSIDREVSKKLFGYLSEELNKQTRHLPLYKHSPTSAQLLEENISKMIHDLNAFTQNFDDVLFFTPQPDFATFIALPSISTVVCEDKTSAIGDFKSLKSLNTYTSQRIPTDHSAPLTCLTVITDNMVATGSKDSYVKLYSTRLQTLIGTLKGHQGPVISLCPFSAFASDLSGDTNVLKKMLQNQIEKERLYLASGGVDGRIVLWDIDNQTKLKILPGGDGAVTTLISIGDGQSLISTTDLGIITVWDFNQAKIVARFEQAHKGPISKSILNKDSSKLITAGVDGLIKVWKLGLTFSVHNQRKTLDRIELEKQLDGIHPILSINTSLTDPNTLVSGGEDGKIKIWSLASGQVEREISGHKSSVWDLTLFENPFEILSKRNFIIISAGKDEEYLRVSVSDCPLNSGLLLDQKINIKQAVGGSPLMQLAKDGTDESAQLLIVNNQEQEFGFLIVKIK